MKLLTIDTLLLALLLVTSASSFSFDLSKRALKYDASCDTKYGSLTAKQLIDKSIAFQPKLAKAGKVGLDTLISALEYQSKAPGSKKPSVSKTELDKIIATYLVLFGDIQATNANGTLNPNFKAEAAKNIAAVKVTRDSLNRMTKAGAPDLIIHCNDDWLAEKGPAKAAPKPTRPLKSGSKYLYDTDRNRWVSVSGGKPCQGNNAAFTTMNKRLSGTTSEKGPERVTFCKDYLKLQHQLEKDKQPHIWDVSKTKLPDTFTTYNKAGKKDQTLPFHISAFGTKIGAKWFQQLMHTELFNPGSNTFSVKRVPNSEGGTGGLAYGFGGSIGLARQKEGKNIGESSRNIDNILYWSLAMYYDKWVWSTGKPENTNSLNAPVGARSVDEDFRVKVAARKPPKKTTKPDKAPETEKPADPPKTEAPPPPPKTEAPPPPPKTEAPPPPPSKTGAPAEPPKVSTRTPSPPTLPPTHALSSLESSQAIPPASSQSPPPEAASRSVTQSERPSNTQFSGTKTTSALSISAPLSVSSSHSRSITAASSLPASCSNTLCAVPSVTPTSSDVVPEETITSEPMNAGSMTGSSILMLAESIVSEQVVAMGLWDKVFAEMGLPAELPSETVANDPTASGGTGLPMATGGAGAAMNGTWNAPVLKANEDSFNRPGGRERRMYDFAS